MLNSMRNAARSWVVIALLGLLGVVVAFTGGFEAFGGGVGRDIAVVGDERISVSQYTREWQDQLRRIRQSQDAVITDADARAAGLPDIILNQLAAQARYLQESEALGVVATDEEIIRAMGRIEALRDPVSGRLDPNLVRQVLASNQLSEQALTDSLAHEIRQTQMLTAIGSGVAAPPFFAALEAAHRLEERVISAVFVPLSAAETPAAPDEAALRAYFDDNQTQFQTPERRAVIVAVLEPDIEAAAENLDPVFIDEAVAEALALRTLPERRTFVELPAPDEATAEAAIQRLRAGETPEAAAAALGLAGVNRYDESALDDVPDGALAETAFALQPGAVSAPVQTRLSWSVVRLDDIAPAITPDDAIVRTEIIAERAEARAEAETAVRGRRFERALTEGASLQDAAAEAGMRVLDIASVDEDGLDQNGDPIAVFTDIPDALTRAFAPTQRPGLTTPLLSTPGAQQFALQVLNIEPSRPQDFDTARAAIAEILTAEGRRTAHAGLVESVRAALADGARAPRAAALVGAQARTETFIAARVAPPVALGRIGGPQAFARERGPGDVFTAPLEDDGAVVARIETILPDAPDADGAAGVFASVVGRSLQQDVQTLYDTALAARYPQRVNRDAIDRATGLTTR